MGGQQPEALPFTTFGTVTGAERAGNELQLLLGPLRVGFDKLLSVSAAS
jgi:hypothetical protein